MATEPIFGDGWGNPGGRSDGNVPVEDPDRDDPRFVEFRKAYYRHLTREWKRRNRYPTTRLGRRAFEALRAVEDEATPMFLKGIRRRH